MKPYLLQIVQDEDAAWAASLPERAPAPAREAKNGVRADAAARKAAAWAAVRELVPGTRKGAMKELSQSARQKYLIEEAISLLDA